ncbi:MAG: HlyD family efflux transporter periplasmic adaptor subunit [Clostridia bacterium]|nr:HlyD family efflux transporter periplasmic adaptor subunit [Clostridia bacterium]
MKKFFVFLLVLALLGGGGYYGWQYYQQHYAQPVSSAVRPSYTEYTIGRGNLSKTVTGTGTLSIARTEEIVLPYAVTVTETLTEEGENVTAGQPLMKIDTAALQTAIDTLQTELETTESELSTLADDYVNAKYLKLTIDGVVKEVYISNGQYIQDVMAERGSIALMSLDGKMYVNIPVQEGMKISSAATVIVGNRYLEAVVRSIEDGMAMITFSDQYAAQGEVVKVRYKQEIVAEAPAYIHMPYYVTTNEQGYIELVNLEENIRKYSGNRICYIINIPMSSTYTALEKTREKQMAQLNEMKALLATGTINAPADGIVSSVVAASATEQAAYTVLSSLYVGDEKEMVISVDELDIISVAVGQNVDIAMDAIEDKTYPATVSKVSQIGTASGGVTVYNVTLTIDGDERLKFGMNGTATIHIEEITDALLVPLTALNTSRGQSYVWVKNADASGDDPGVRTSIETGLSSEDYAQVLSGLNEGDVILITRESSDDSSSRSPFGNMGGGGMMNFGGMGGGAMPSMPSGGGNGGNRGGNRP